MKSFVAAMAATLLASVAPAQVAPRVTYIQAGAVLAAPGNAPRGATTIVVRGDKIAELRDGFVAPEAGATLVDLRNQFVLPGLIDMHVHFYSDGDPLHQRLTAANRDYEDNVLLAANHARETASVRCATRSTAATSKGRRSSTPAR